MIYASGLLVLFYRTMHKRNRTKMDVRTWKLYGMMKMLKDAILKDSISQNCQIKKNHLMFVESQLSKLLLTLQLNS
jgi:hypothetical protein